MLLSRGSRVGGAALAVAQANNRANASLCFNVDLLVGAGLLAKAVCQSPDALTDIPPSRASPLPHFDWVCRFLAVSARGYLSLRACLQVSQNPPACTASLSSLRLLGRCSSAIRFSSLRVKLSRTTPTFMAAVRRAPSGAPAFA